MIRRTLPMKTWQITWYCVPYQYVLSDNSYFDKYVGYVNQQTIFGWKPGQALVQSVKTVNIYTPPFPEFTNYTGSLAPSQDKLCDIEITILDCPRVAANRIVPVNQSHVIDGHNSSYFRLGQLAYYNELGRDLVPLLGIRLPPGQGQPLFPSFPLDLLFQNPDGPP